MVHHRPHHIWSFKMNIDNVMMDNLFKCKFCFSLTSVSILPVILISVMVVYPASSATQRRVLSAAMQQPRKFIFETIGSSSTILPSPRVRMKLAGSNPLATRSSFAGCDDKIREDISKKRLTAEAVVVLLMYLPAAEQEDTVCHRSVLSGQNQ